MMALILLGTLALTLALSLLVARSIDRQHEHVKVHCETKGRDVDIDVLVRPRRWNFGDEYDVVRCSAFEDPRRVTCDKHCLEPFGHASGRT